jgi:hypothetical protein
MTIDFEALAAPFPPDAVSWRVGTSNKKKRQKETGDNYAKATKGIALAYLDARDVMGRLDDVCGPGGWQNRYSHTAGKTVCDIGVKVGDEWVWKADGAGDSDIEAEKGALSDAFKRAAVRWGIGRYLYAVSSPWCDLDEREQITEADRKKLRALLTNAAPAPARPVEEPKPPAATALTLAERADRFEDVLRRTKPDDLSKVWAKAFGLCAELDATLPERLAELTTLYEGLIDLASQTPFTKEEAK